MDRALEKLRDLIVTPIGFFAFIALFGYAVYNMVPSKPNNRSEDAPAKVANLVGLSGRVLADGKPLQEGNIMFIARGGDNHRRSAKIVNGRFVFPETSGLNLGEVYRVELYQQTPTGKTKVDPESNKSVNETVNSFPPHGGETSDIEYACTSQRPGDWTLQLSRKPKAGATNRAKGG